ncbi:hypothetical protein C2G38_2123554 [Gigaspora rosea]|uniref:Uncharacterized protein n=1 Tax=Gigaspora rosea TaxID=44941 RepID=A0A397U7C3_9GLOM|nr:hypothetical protein C2G38_2123554 [Gigaspora rosea]
MCKRSKQGLLRIKYYKLIKKDTIRKKYCFDLYHVEESPYKFNYVVDEIKDDDLIAYSLFFYYRNSRRCGAN